MHFKKNLQGEQHPHAKLLDQQAEMIRQRYEQGTSQRQLAREYGVSHQVVFRIIWGQSYRPRR